MCSVSVLGAMSCARSFRRRRQGTAMAAREGGDRRTPGRTTNIAFQGALQAPERCRVHQRGAEAPAWSCTPTCSRECPRRSGDAAEGARCQHQAGSDVPCRPADHRCGPCRGSSPRIGLCRPPSARSRGPNSPIQRQNRHGEGLGSRSAQRRRFSSKRLIAEDQVAHGLQIGVVASASPLRRS